VDVEAGEEVTCTFYNELLPLSVCPAQSAGNELTRILGVGMGSTTAYKAVNKIVVPDNTNVLSLYGQLAGKEVGPYKYARFIRPNSTYINDKTLESPAYRGSAVFWFGQELTPSTLSYWKARLIGAPTTKPFVQRAFILYPTYQTETPFVNVFDPLAFDQSIENHVYWDALAGWIPQQMYDMTIPPPGQPVDVTVQVALVDNDRDARPVELTVSAGQSSVTVTPAGPSNGDLLNIITITLEDVAPGTDTIAIQLVSPQTTGDSVAIVGATANYACVDQN
jgi:hypothetical protein